MKKNHRKRRRPIIGLKGERHRFPTVRVKFGSLSRALGLVLLCSSVIFLAAWIGLFDLLRIDSWVERRFIAYARSFTSGEIDQSVVLVTASEDPAKNGGLGKPDEKWRVHHAELLRALSNAGAQVVAFDLLFESQSDSKTDQNFGEAIKRAKENGTTVVIGVNQFNLEKGVPAAIVLLWGVLLPFAGIHNPDGSTTSLSWPSTFAMFQNGLSLSLITFVTLGYGNRYPISPAGEFLAGFEALSGILLASIFVVSFAKKVIRG